MVCIAAFIILSIISVFVGFLSLFNKQLGQKYWSVFKKAWHCVFKKVRLQKCDTNFKDDVKNTLLKHLVLKHPKLLKPASIIIEIISILIVFITVWSFAIAIKSLLALWVFGTCNVSQPSQCGLGAESCTIDQSEPTDFIGKVGRSFSEWGEIFSAIPDRLKNWETKDYFTSSSVPRIRKHYLNFIRTTPSLNPPRLLLISSTQAALFVCNLIAIRSNLVSSIDILPSPISMPSQLQMVAISLLTLS